jgi:small subunit ribosomal protein S6
MREYELVLMLDPGRDAPARDALAQQAKAQIEAAGALKHENNWGLRKMAYEIEQRTEADYRWFRFEAPTELLGELDHNLKIADGVLRFRIFKVDPAMPVIVPPAGPAAGSSRERPAQGGRHDDAEPAPSEPGAEPAPQTAAEPAPEAAPQSSPEPAPEPAAEAAPEAAAEPAAEGAGGEQPAEPTAE